MKDQMQYFKVLCTCSHSSKT